VIRELRSLSSQCSRPRAGGNRDFCERVGCDISFDFATVTLNYGLFVSNNDEFDGAVQILKKVRRIGKGVKYVENPEEDRIIEDGLCLFNFCEGMTK